MPRLQRPHRPHLPDHDSTTGDEITRTEALSALAQSVIRRWTFIGLFLAVTVPCFVLGGAVLGWWNYAASALAIVIESVVGIGVFNMGKRDAVILREVRHLSERGAKQARKATKAAQRTEEAATRVERMADLMLDHLQRMD